MIECNKSRSNLLLSEKLIFKSLDPERFKPEPEFIDVESVRIINGRSFLNIISKLYSLLLRVSINILLFVPSITFSLFSFSNKSTVLAPTTVGKNTLFANSIPVLGFTFEPLVPPENVPSGRSTKYLAPLLVSFL